VRIVTDTNSNSGELRIVDGNEKIIDCHVDGTVVAMDSIRDLIVFITCDGDDWTVYRYWKSNLVELYKCTDHRLCGTDGKQLSTVLRWESEENIKLYIANGIDPLISLQLYTPKNDHGEDTTYGEQEYDKMFKYNNVNLPAPTLTVKNGGAIPAAVV